jgi:Glycosyltransferase family 87
VRPAAGPYRRAAAAPLKLPLQPAALVIAAAALLALGLRIYQLAQPGHLLGVGDYDDGADFGSALQLIHGVLPYRDFIIVQPPGITLLMTPAALLSRLAGSAGAIAAARILTVAASAACVVLGGLLVRHRGTFATVVTCGVIAIYPGSVQAAHTVLLEPWLTACCLAGAVAVFDGDRLASGRRLAWGGAALGFAGAVKVWAIIPVAVIALACLPRPRQAARFAAGVAAGFAVPALPFLILAPGRFADSVVVAQLTRTGARTPLAFRLEYLTGLTGWQPSAAVLWAAAAVIAAVVAGAPAAAWLATRQAPSRLEWFAIATTVLVVVAFLAPDDFYYHYSAFLAPFLAMAIALPVDRLISTRPDAPGTQRLRRPATGLAALAILVLPLALPGAEDTALPTYAHALPAIERAVPPGACVLSDQESVLISAGRFLPSSAGCPVIVDGTGTGYALGGGRSSQQAGTVPAVAALWLHGFQAAQYVLLTPANGKRIAWTPRLESYFAGNFIRIRGDWAPLMLYVRISA